MTASFDLHHHKHFPKKKNKKEHEKAADLAFKL